MTREDFVIDWVAPPFAGHLFPMLLVGKQLRDLGFVRQRVFCTPSGRAATEESGLEFVEILGSREDAILEVANGNARVGGNPFALVAQFKKTLGFLSEVKDAMHTEWAASPPHVAIVDSVLPTAGMAARQEGARWWTSMAALSPTETRRGTPSYFGGWTPGRGPLYRLRDALGRTCTRGFKRTAGFIARRELRSFGLGGVYREDGLEACYSDDVILGLGHESFEFERDWPPAMEFVGCPVGSPVRNGAAPEVEPTRPHVLVTLGTHLHWAKDDALERARALSQLLPEWTVHFSRGDSRGDVACVRGRVHEYSYVPYGPNLSMYCAVLHHGGAGITYAALAAGTPSLVWPRDYDQFDNAARVVGSGTGLRTNGSPAPMARDLRRLVSEPCFAAACAAMRSKLEARDPAVEIARLLDEARQA